MTEYIERWSKYADPYVEEATVRNDALYDMTCDVLDRAGYAYEKMMRCKERCEMLSNRATQCGCMNYERMGMYGVKIISSHNDHAVEDLYCDLYEAEEEYEESKKEYEKARQELIDLIQSAGLSDRQQRVMYLRYVDGTYPDFNKIAYRCGLPSYGAAWQQYKRAFVKIAMHLKGRAS